MKTHPRYFGTGKDAYALFMVLLFGGVGMLALAGALGWVQTNGTLISRSNQNYRAAAAAEAATEIVLARLSRDFKNSGESTAYGNLSTYSGLVPTASDNALWSEFTFSNGQGNNGQTYVSRTASSTYTTLDSQYSGLLGFASTYRIVSNARENNMRFDVPGAVQQDVQLASIPIFQFAIFYTGDMELNGASTLHVRGRVHGNSNFYLGSGSSQYFYEDVTVSGAIVYGSRYGWSTNGGTQYFYDTKETNRSALTLPIGTNNTAAAVREVLQMPPSSESIDSAMGRERYYNKAELVVLVSNSTVTVGVKQPFSSTLTSVPWLATTNFLSTNALFVDKRENSKQVQTTQVDVGRFSTWAATNSTVISVLGTGVKPNLVYVGDFRTESSTKMNGVRLVNAQTLPDRGLTVATPNPLYTKGHFNQPNSSYLGTTNTSNTKPASLAADAYTLLSDAFSDSASGNNDPATRVAVNTTVVAALIAGNVPSGSVYSGGVNNLPRLLEAWSGKTYTLNGSLVCLYNSAKATNVFQNPGAYYSAPTRSINFDQNLTDPLKLPPGTPQMRVLVRGKWVNPPPGTVSYTGS
jgi:hypothetical protein